MPFDLQPTLTGELLELRPLRPADYDALYAVASDPLVWEQHPYRERYREEVFRRLFQESMDSGGALIATDRESGRVIGSSRFHEYNEERSEIEIGWSYLARQYWGGRYNREMKRLMLHHAFRFVESVLFIVGPENYRSQRAVEKLGAVREGTFTEPDGLVQVVYRLTPELYAASDYPISGDQHAR